MKKRRTQDQSSFRPSITNADNHTDIESTTVVTPGRFGSRPTPYGSTATPTQPPDLLSSPQNTTRPTASESPGSTSPPPRRPKDATPELYIDRILKDGHEESTYIQQSIFIVRSHKRDSDASTNSVRRVMTMVNTPPGQQAGLI